ARDGDMQRRSAALLLLGELGCDDPTAIDVAGAALDSSNAVLREFALGYAEKVKSADLLRHLAPLLGVDDTTVRARAERLLLDAGKSGIEAAAGALGRLSGRPRSVVAEWVAQQQGKKPLDALIRLLGSGDHEAVRQAARALEAACVNADGER